MWLCGTDLDAQQFPPIASIIQHTQIYIICPIYNISWVVTYFQKCNLAPPWFLLTVHFGNSPWGGPTIVTIHLPGSNLYFYLSPNRCSPPGFGASRGGKLQYFPPMGGTSKIVTYISDPLPLKTMAKRVGIL